MRRRKRYSEGNGEDHSPRYYQFSQSSLRPISLHLHIRLSLLNPRDRGQQHRSHSTQERGEQLPDPKQGRTAGQHEPQQLIRLVQIFLARDVVLLRLGVLHQMQFGREVHVGSVEGEVDGGEALGDVDE
jgi:hypothetical protein